MKQLGPGSIEWQLRNRTTERDELQKLVDTYRLESKRLLEQLETARKALNEARDVIAEIAYNGAYCGSNGAVFAQDYLERLAQIGAGRPPVQPCGHEWRHCHFGTCQKCEKQLAKRTEPSAEREGE